MNNAAEQIIKIINERMCAACCSRIENAACGMLNDLIVIHGEDFSLEGATRALDDLAKTSISIKREINPDLPEFGVTVTKRRDDFHACITGHPELWVSGKTGEEALGKLMLTYPDQFGMSRGNIQYFGFAGQ